MNRLVKPLFFVSFVTLTAGGLALTQPVKEATAGVPLKMHGPMEHIAGVWTGRAQMWIGPGVQEPVEGVCTWRVTPILGGRYVRCEVSGSLPGVGPFTGERVCGFDTVTGKFVGSWVDTHSNDVIQGTGEPSEDGRTITWSYTSSCPITGTPAMIRESHTTTVPGTMLFELFVTDTGANKEYKRLRVDFTRLPA